ncbi:hypothetical protein [Deinococcus radiophilus]|uniref:hypothetical protein n=1 Tax=Deinococcus radiophilus TaxID=32062 RepID=UPI00361DBF5F
MEAEVAGTRMQGRLGSYLDGTDFVLEFTPEGAAGRIGGVLDGQDMTLQLYAGEVRGRLGGVTQGWDVRMDLGAVPFPLAALLAVCAHRVQTESQRAAQDARRQG